MKKPICLITGVGAGTGASVARRFAKGGYQVAMLARNRDRLVELENEIEDAKAYPCDISDLDALQATIKSIQSEMGTPSVLVHNAVAATFKTFLEADPEDLERNFRVNTTTLLYLARALAPAMVEAGDGAIMVTGNTAALRGIPTYAVFAPSKAAQRILAQSLARDLGPKGVHVAYITTDAAINAPWLGDDTQKPSWLKPPPSWKNKPEDYFSNPNAIADEVFHIAHQDRSTWSFDHIIRPYAENW
ncbi:MAG: SDR family NAD(P)-dependent oxidoreductase [Gammaproteobacteria bacterium]|nr:SDR family NAD(P)-dependent oxidoreductase [Gammaproteobacteria bacterium]